MPPRSKGSAGDWVAEHPLRTDVIWHTRRPFLIPKRRQYQTDLSEKSALIFEKDTKFRSTNSVGSNVVWITILAKKCNRISNLYFVLAEREGFESPLTRSRATMHEYCTASDR
jgi:hypothetical protein